MFNMELHKIECEFTICKLDSVDGRCLTHL